MSLAFLIASAALVRAACRISANCCARGVGLSRLGIMGTDVALLTQAHVVLYVGQRLLPVVDPAEPVKVAVDSGTASGGAAPASAESGGAQSGRAEPGGAAPARAASGGALGVPPRREPLSPQRLHEWYSRLCQGTAGASRGAAGAGGAAGAAGGAAGAAGGAAGAGGATGAAGGAAGAGGATGAAGGDAGAGGAAGASGGAAGASGAPGPSGGAAGAGAAGGAAAAGAAGGAGGAAGTGDPEAEGTGPVSAFFGGVMRPRPYYVPLLQQVLSSPPSPGPPHFLSPPPVRSQSQLQPASPLPGPSPYFGPTKGLTERREPESRPVSPASRAASPVCTARAGCVSRPRLPPVPGTHSMTLRPSTAPQHVPLPSPPASSLPDGPDPESDSLRATSPTVTRFLATAVTDPLFESSAASALVAELFDFAATCRLDYAASLVAKSVSASVCPPSVGGECAPGTDVLEDRQEDLECFAAASPHLVSMLLAPEGDLDALDIPTPRSYAEAIEGPYSSQWQAAMDAEMASWKSKGTYVVKVPAPGANIVSGMWIFRVKRPSGSPPAFKARYVAGGFSQQQGVDFFQTFSPTPKMTTLHVAAQRDYELHSLDFNTAFLQGSLHEEIWLRPPPGFTGSFPSGTQWSLRRPVYSLRQAPREWHDTLRTTLAALGFAPSTADPSLFLRPDASLPPFYVLVYVDDLVLATADTEALAHVKSELQKRHTCTDLGPSALRLHVLLATVHSSATGHSLSAPPSDESVEPSGPYPELVGCLITSGMGLVLGGRARVVLTGHADASWVDELATQRSSQGYTFSLGSGYVSWRSTRSSSVLSSSCEAEIYAGAMAAQELRWLTYLLTDLGEASRSPPVLYVDNKAMLALSQEHRLEHRTKHIALRYFLARELQQRGQLHLAYVASQANTADVFTKALQPCDHQRSGSGGGGGGGGGAGRGAAAQRGGASGSQRQQQPRSSETPSVQQLREWYAGRGRSGGAGPCVYVLRTSPHSGEVCGIPHITQRCFGRLTDAWRTQFPNSVELPRWHDLLLQNVPIFDLDFDAILAAMYALADITEGDCYLSVLPDPSTAAAALGASTAAALGASASAAPGAGTSTLSGTAPTESLHTFTLDSGASRSFFRDSTTLTPLSRRVAVSLADPSGGPVLARSSTVLPCPAAPSGVLSGIHLPLFSTNLVSGADLQDAWVDQFTPGGQRVIHCTCSRTGRHLATFTRRPGSSVYTLTTAPPLVSASGQVVASSQVFAAASRSSPASAPCSCCPLSHETLLWHHRLGHPSLPRLRGMASRALVSGLPWSLPPLLPGPASTCVPSVEGRQRAAPHSSSFPPTEAPLQTLHMDVWGLARVRGQGHERYFLLVVDDYSRYTTVFPLRSKGEVPDVLIDWIRGARRQLSESFGSDLPTFTLPASPQQNGIAERRIGMVMDVARTSMIHAAAPHFLWPFAVQYAAHQINLQPRVSLPETTPTLRWTRKVGDASAFRVWGSRAFVRDTTADKLSSRAVPCVFLDFPPDAPGWQFYHPTLRRVMSSHDVTFDESVSYYRLFPYRTSSPPPPPLFLAPGTPQVDPAEPVEVAVDSGAARGAEPAGAGTGGAETGGAGSGGAESVRAEPGRVEPEGAVFGGANPARAASGGALGVPPRREPFSPQQLCEWYSQRCRGAAGASGGAAGAGGTAGVSGGAASSSAAGGVAGAGGAAGAGAAGAGAAGGATGGDAGAGGAADAGASGGAASAGGATKGAAGAGGAAVASGGAAGGAAGAAGTGDPGAEGAGAVSAVSGGAVRSRLYYVPLLQQPASTLPGPSPYSGPTRGLTERCEPESRPVSPVSRSTSPVRSVRAGRVSRPRPPPVPGTHSMTLRPSTAPQRVPLPSPPASSLLDGPDPESDSLRAASPTVCPPSVGGECALGTDVLEDRQEEFECFAASVPHLVSMLLTPEGDPDALDIPTPRSYAEAIEGPYSSQWQAATEMEEMDAEMASWKSTGTYVDEVPPPRANIVSGMWIFRGVDFFPTFSPTPKMTTLRVLLHVAAHRDYELHSLDFSTAFLHGSLHEEIWLHRPPGFTGSLPAGTQWSLRRPVYGLRQAPRECHNSLRTTLASLGFAPSTSDPSLFLHTNTTLPLFYVLVYVDDLIFATADTEALAHVKSELQKRHTCTDLGELTSYLGLRITRDRAQCTITLTQSHMVQQVLQRFGFTYSSPQSTPLPTGHSLSAPPSDESVEPSGPYPELVGCLMYLMTCTRPDLLCPLSLLARYVAPGRHRKVHWDAAKRVLRYLCSSLGMGLVLGGRARVVLTGHTDASWVDELATQRSSQGYTFSLGSGSVSWRSTRSSSVLSSSCEAEIYAGAMAAQELRWLTYLLTDLGEASRSPPVLYVDNKAMLALSQEHRLEHRTKHIALRYFLARELQQRGQLHLAYVASQANTADVFTKALQPCDHQRFCTVLGLVPTVPHLLSA
ncbi:unnamed protein product [Closterium sp. NIES-53]